MSRSLKAQAKQWHGCSDCFGQTLDPGDLTDGRCDHCAELAAKWPGWTIALCEPKEPAGIGHQPTVLNPRRRFRNADGEIRYRAACFACDWLGPERAGDSNLAVEDAHDHTHPGWRELPVLPRVRRTGDTKADSRRLAKICGEVESLYLHRLGIDLAELVHRAWPIRTMRERFGTRHVPSYSHWGGYDLCAGVITDDRDLDEQLQPEVAQLALFA